MIRQSIFYVTITGSSVVYLSELMLEFSNYGERPDEIVREYRLLLTDGWKTVNLRVIIFRYNEAIRVLIL